MLLKAIVQTLELKRRSDASEEVDVVFGYASDLLSDVLANAAKGAVWVTNQKHQNIVGVAVMLGLSAVVIAGGVEPDDNAVEKAASEGVALYTSDMSVFDLAGRMYELGIRGS